MGKFWNIGDKIRSVESELILEYMASKDKCGLGAEGVKQAEIFRECGFDWGNQTNASSTNQQYWVIGALRSLERQGKVEQIPDTRRWRLL